MKTLAVSTSRFLSAVCYLQLPLLLVFAAGYAVAEDLEKKSTFGIWSVYCAKPEPTTYSDCSITAGAVAKDDPAAWAKIGLAIVTPTGDLEMTVRTPRLNFFRHGISIGFDGRQSGRAFIDKCSASSCETTIRLTQKFINHLGIRDRLTVEYQVGERDGVILGFDLTGFVHALSNLQTIVGLSLKAIHSLQSSNPNNFEGQGSNASFGFKVERHQPQPVAKTANASAAPPSRKCNELPLTKKVRAAFDPGLQSGADDVHLDVENKNEINNWLQACADSSVAWVKEPESTKTSGHRKVTGDERLAKEIERTAFLTVMRFLKGQKIPTVVYSESGKVRTRSPNFEISSVNTGRPDPDL